jgi:hypothetical protein
LVCVSRLERVAARTAAALVAAAFGGQPLLASWTQIFMASAARFLAQFFPLFLLGAVFGKLMDDSGSVSTVAKMMTKTFGDRHGMLAVVLAGAVVTLWRRQRRAGLDRRHRARHGARLFLNARQGRLHPHVIAQWNTAIGLEGPHPSATIRQYALDPHLLLSSRGSSSATR